MAYNIRALESGHWVDTFHSEATKTAAVKKMKEMQKGYRGMGFKGTAGYDLAVFDGRKKVAETKRNPASSPAGKRESAAERTARFRAGAAERDAWFRAAEAMEPSSLDDLSKAAQKATGLDYESAEAKAIIGKEDWLGYYPEVDAWGALTGNVIDIDDERYIIIEDLVMIDRGGLDKAELAKLREGYFPVRD